MKTVDKIKKSDNDIALFYLSAFCQKFVKNRRNILKHFEIKHETINTKNIVIISD